MGAEKAKLDIAPFALIRACRARLLAKTFGVTGRRLGRFVVNRKIFKNSCNAARKTHEYQVETILKP